MAHTKSPAFQFYANDWTSGTLALSLEECGAYITLLAYQWDTGAVPDEHAARARICRCSVAQAKRVWTAIAGKFQQGTDGLWRNARLESERTKQEAYRELQRDKGLASARNRATNRKATEPQPSHQPEGQPTGNRQVNREATLLSSSSSSEKQEQQNGHAAAPLVMGPLAYERRKQQCAFVGARLEVPHSLHGDLRKQLGGANADAELLAWYGDLDEEIEGSGEAILPDVFKWLKARLVTWKGAAGETRTTEQIVAEIEKIRAARVAAKAARS